MPAERQPQEAPVAIEDVVESVAKGVMRALDARQAGEARARPITSEELVKSGFNIEILIRVGGWPGGSPISPNSPLSGGVVRGGQ